MRIKRSILNLLLGLVSQATIILLGIFIPRLFLVNYGSETNGLVASITQVISYLTLLEAGVGAASLQALYKPVSLNKKDSINSILSATSKYYKKTGIYYFFTVILIAVLYPLLVDSEINRVEIMIIVILTGMGGAINYYFQGRFRVLLQAEGKSYIETSIQTIANIVSSIIRIILLYNGVSLIAVQGAFFFVLVLQMIIFQVYVNKHYKWLDFNVEPDYQSIEQKGSVMIHEISYMVFRNTDLLILTIFTNLKTVSIYVMYNFIFTIIDNVVMTVNTSIKFILGQSYHEGREKFIKFYDVYELYFMSFVFSLLTITYIAILPFMKLYTAGVTDVNYIDFWLPVLFLTIKLLVNARSSSNNIITIAGHFRNTQYRSILESGINLFCSVVFVIFLGIYGVLLGTIVAVIYRSIDIIIYANKEVLNRSPWRTIRRWIINVIILLSIVLIERVVNYNINSYGDFILLCIILLLTVMPLYFVINSLVEKNVFLYMLEFVKGYYNQIKTPKLQDEGGK